MPKNLPEKVKALQKLRATIARLQDDESKLQIVIADELGLSVNYLMNPRTEARPPKNSGVVAAVKTPKAKARTRAKVTDAMREKVRAMSAEGISARVIGAKIGVSMPTVQNIRKALGLTRKRPKK